MEQHPSRIFMLFVGCMLFLSNTTSAQVATTRPPTREYVIGVGDRLDILVWGFPEFSSKVEVRSDGKITLPMLGDVQAARLTTSMLKTTLADEETIGKYITNPNITITVAQSSPKISIIVLGQSLVMDRGITIGQLLVQVVPKLPSEPAPNLSAVKVIGINEEFTVDWPVLEIGKAPEMDIRLEWGDEIVIPSVKAMDSPPITISPANTSMSKTFTREELTALLSDVPPDKLDMLLAIATQTEDGRYTLDLSKISEEQQQQIGADIIARLFPQEPSEYQDFSEITLVALAVNLAREHGVEAFIATPNPENDGLPIIRCVAEGDLIQEGETPEEDVYLKEINDMEKVAILQKGEALQRLTLVMPNSAIKLSGIQKYGAGRKAFFSKLPKVSEKKPMTRAFEEQDVLPDGSKIAQITDEWVLLQRDTAFEFLLLRNSYDRETETASSVTLPNNLEEKSLDPNNPQSLPSSKISPEILKALPEPLKALNTYSKLFFATPLIE